ncbi:hypothetical protein CQW23_07676 [Capsicum baccatum]|uniref:F-box domain-containing protein n=1 Tax=Capsicum baccatum TaxID=33114 RepID=A0A2G2X6S4_CAPBA|nr:hypothetical protein CQW23_07676 [Capsicum baccatum]
MSSKDKMTICPVTHSYTSIIVVVLVSKALSASEFKQAMVTHRRRRKVQPVLEGRSQLPQDVLVHVFGFLDLKSVLTASLVCRSWSVAASDNYLWQLIHISFFGKSSDNPNIIRLTYGVDTPVNTVAANLDWKDAFKQAYRGISIKATSQRGFCKRCKSFVWLSNSKCSNGCYGKISDEHHIMPVSLKQIVDYVTMEYSIPCLDCDRDSDDSVDGLDYSVYLDDSVVGSPY